jgi:hypothetical protein
LIASRVKLRESGKKCRSVPAVAALQPGYGRRSARRGCAFLAERSQLEKRSDINRGADGLGGREPRKLAETKLTKRS